MPNPTPHSAAVRSTYGYVPLVVVLALFAGNGAQAATDEQSVYPKVAQTLQPIDLPDLIYAALPPKATGAFGWDHLLDAPILWVTNGYSLEAGKASRVGIARVRVATRTSTILRQRREELAWTVSMETDANPKFGPQKIEIVAGAANEQCFGSLTDNCAFDESETLDSPKLGAQRICRVTPSGFPLTVYRVSAPDKQPAYVRVWTSGGSGGVASSISITLSPMDCSY